MTTDDFVISKELKIEFVNIWLNEVESLLSLPSESTFEERSFCQLVSNAGHRMKGNGATFGFEYMTKQGKILEDLGYDLARNSNDDEVARGTEELLRVLSEIKEYLVEQKRALD